METGTTQEQDKVLSPRELGVKGAFSYICTNCDFAPFIPLTELEYGIVGLVNDSRYPGRLIFAAKHHYEYLDEADEQTYINFMREVRLLSNLLRKELKKDGCDKVNIAIMGNELHHAHAHIIPRYKDKEGAKATRPIWEDERKAEKLSQDDIATLGKRILERLY